MLTVTMAPGPNECLVRYVGDCLTFRVHSSAIHDRAFLRTNLGRARVERQLTIFEHQRLLAKHLGEASPLNNLPLESAWRDVPMTKDGQGWQVAVALAEVGFFEAKAYLVDQEGKLHWPIGENFRLTVHPNHTRTGNTIYCAFARMFGATKNLEGTRDEVQFEQLKQLDSQGFTVIPPSGTLRDLTRELPHIFETLNCRVLHLLPVNPTPTTYGRFGRFGSPYAVQDLMAIDPALVEFDRESTGVEQFCELTHEVHCRRGRVLLDVVVNHTGWGSKEMEQHPEWFLKSSDGRFVSPGAWGTVWEDLAEIDHAQPVSWNYFAEVFLTWCRRGVDGFRCDAGYKVPVPCWKYIVARVRDEFPDTVFFLEGLGGSWEATRALVQEGGMQWAYSELFQNFSPRDISTYLDHCFQQSNKCGVLVHYSETHDNDRLAGKGKEWSKVRNNLSALTSTAGAFGFTGGGEWLAAEKINVHSSRGLSWGSSKNILQEIATLNQILADHPCFFDGAKTTRLSDPSSPVYALLRTSTNNQDRVLVLVNLDPESAHTFVINEQAYESMGRPRFDLLKFAAPTRSPEAFETGLSWKLEPLETCCLANHQRGQGLSGEAYRDARERSGFAFQCFAKVMNPEAFGTLKWEDLASQVYSDPRKFLASIKKLTDVERGSKTEPPRNTANYINVVVWEEIDQSRILTVPPDHWLLVQHPTPFRVRLAINGQTIVHQQESVAVKSGHIACFWASEMSAKSSDATLELECLSIPKRSLSGGMRFLSPEPYLDQGNHSFNLFRAEPERWPMVLLTNGRGGMARFCLDIGRVKSKYDCLLGANLDEVLPVDRHIFVKRVRIWLDAEGLVTPLNIQCIVSFRSEPTPTWCFRAATPTGDMVLVRMNAEMVPHQNTTILRFNQESEPPSLNLKLIVRLDIEDRHFHSETHRNPDSEIHFRNHCRSLKESVGFEFTPTRDRQLRAVASRGKFSFQEEWVQGIEHPVEGNRGQVAHGDAFSPGWFELPLLSKDPVQLLMSSESESGCSLGEWVPDSSNSITVGRVQESFENTLNRSIRSFLVQRNQQTTVIAGYPWFLDWGRDTLICARGLIAGGHLVEVRELLLALGRFEHNGTLPNTFQGSDSSNRDTSDAPLWFGIICEELAEKVGEDLYDLVVELGGRTLLQVLESIGSSYLNETPNGIHVDKQSGLVWSPSHFTWMDTNHPAGTPRNGYPVEIQALWIRLLKQLDQRSGTEEWGAWAEQANVSFQQLYWLETEGYFADCLITESGCGAAQAIVSDALRSNCLFAITLGLVTGERAERTVEAATRWLVLPGALRSLAPKSVKVGLPIVSNHGQPLNDPHNPYWGHYQGDEDTKRKPAYHNGTAWTWTFPTFCEAIATAWKFSPESIAAARAWLGSVDYLLNEGCIGHIPEILDGDAPHLPRGCDAQAWASTEVLRVWKILNHKPFRESNIVPTS